MRTKLTPTAQKQSLEFRERIAKLRQRLNRAPARVARVGIVLNSLPPLYDSALSGSVPHALRAGARLIRAMGLIKLVSAKEKAEANTFLSEPVA
ncbi:MAG: hypothetical protein JXQ71_13875 [Verrucomicrobia bacterium]|nr:hypothetical protein [Verrucomicrobiota bacterium]